MTLQQLARSFAFLALTALTNPAAQAYVPTTTNKSQQPVGWRDSNCVMVVANSAGSADISDGSDLVAIDSSAKKWHKAVVGCSFMRISLQEASSTTVPAFDKKGENTNTIYWSEELCGEEPKAGCWSHDENAAAITTVSFVDNPNSERDGQIIDADIELNGVYFTFTTSAAVETDIENTLVHELGHLMGLDHPCDDGVRSPPPYDHLGRRIPPCGREPDWYQEVTMYNFADYGETKKRSPEKDDVRGICDLYPVKSDPGVCKAAELPGGPCTVGGSGSLPEVSGLLLLLFVALRINRRRRVGVSQGQ